MKTPIFKFYDPFNDKTSRISTAYEGLEDFFHDFETAIRHGNNPILMQYTGRNDSTDNPIFSGAILEVNFSYQDKFDGEIVAVEIKRVGIVRYQPSKGFVISKCFESVTDSDGNQGCYHKVSGAFQFSASNAIVLANINGDDKVYRDIEAKANNQILEL